MKIYDQDNCCGMTPLMHAANGFHILSIETFFKNAHSIDLNKKDKYGRTALMLACKENSPLAVEALLDKKAEVNLQDLEGKTALIWLTSNYNNWGQYKDREIEISENLLKHGAMVDLADNHGMTALMIASDRGHTSLIKIYLEHGADPYKQNHAGESAIDIAKHKYNRECLTILENHEMMQFVDERAKGTEPLWSTIKRRFWKNKEASLTPEEINKLEKLNFGNVARMKQGKPPQQFSKEKFKNYGGDGMESKELHHDPIPKRDGGKLVEDLWPQEHAAKDPYRNLGY